MATKRVIIPKDLPAAALRATAGASHTILLLEDGAILTFGWNDHSQCDVPPSLGRRRVKNVSAGEFHTLILADDGEVLAFGDNRSGQCNITEALAGKPPKSVEQIAAGGSHSVLLLADGSVVTCGSNDEGQCNVPTLAAGVKQVAAGSNHTVLLLEDDTIVAFGHNKYGQCNVPAMSEEEKKKVASATAGGFHTVLLYDDDTLVVTGSNDTGQCKMPSRLATRTGAKIIQVAAGGFHTVVLFEDGTVEAFGSNGGGRCDVPSRDIMEGGKGSRSRRKRAVRGVACGSSHTVLILDDGSAILFGTNVRGQCGEQGAGPFWTYTAPPQKRSTSPTPSLLPSHWTGEDIPPEGWAAQPLFPGKAGKLVEALQNLCKVRQPELLEKGKVPYTNLELCAAWRIEDPALFARYSSEQRMVDRQLAALHAALPPLYQSKLNEHAGDLPVPLREDLNESWFLHATTPQALLGSLNNGLNDRRSSSGAAFGAGMYMCEDVEKADQGAVPDAGPETPGLEDLHARLYRAGGPQHPGPEIFYCFLARVLCGAQIHTRGLQKGPRSIADAETGAQIFVDETRRELVHVPDSTPPFHYHSLVCGTGKAQRFREFVIPDANRIYIEYLIAYRRV